MKIKVFGVINDCGDGSHSAYLYNDPQEHVDDQNKYADEDEKLTLEKFMEEDDTYMNGYPCGWVEIEIGEDGRLVKPVGFSGG